MNLISGLKTNHNELEILIKGFINILQVDGTFIEDLAFLIEFVSQGNKFSQKAKDKLAVLFEDDFDVEAAKKIFINNEKLKEFFFEMSVMLASLDQLSEDEIEILNEYAEEFKFNKSKLNSIIETVNHELEKAAYETIEKHFSIVLKGYVKYLNDNQSDDLRHLGSLRQLYCLTNGRINDLIVFITRYFNPPKKFEDIKGFLGEFKKEDIEFITDKLHTDGYYIFENKLSEEICNKLIDYTLTNPSTPRILNNPNAEKVIFDKNNLLSTRYDFDNQDIVEIDIIQELLMDKTFYSIAQEYFGCEPAFDFSAMWWNTDFLRKNYTGQNDRNLALFQMSESALLYHFDMDRTKFLKMFVYLNDVDENNGPHSIVKGSNTYKPYSLLRDGRIRDQEIADSYPKENIIEVKGKKGTVFIEDTSSFHKGSSLNSGERLVLQFEFATDLFGQTYPPVKITEKFSEQFKGFIKDNPYVFINFR